MSQQTVLLVEDNFRDARLVQRAFVQAGISYDLRVVRDGEHALAYLRREETYSDPDAAPTPALILLDLNLPGMSGHDVLMSCKQDDRFARIPVILLTGQDAREVDMEAMKAGADDYLVKDRIDASLLERAIRYAIERRRLLLEIERRQHELEIRSLERLSHPAAAGAPSRGLSEFQRLRETQPETFAQLVQRYGDMLEMVLEREAYREGYNLSQELGDIGERLGHLNVGPGDVLAIHTAAFKRYLSASNAQRAQTYMRESRLLVIDLMGKLVSFYRHHFLSLRDASASLPNQPPHNNEQ